MLLAWHNIAFNRTRFAVTVLGIAAAVFLIVFQGSILTGFLEASSKIIDSSDADLWIMARGVECFEFPAPIEKRFVEIAHSVGGVSGATPVCIRAAQFRKADGSHQVVALIGADSDARPRVRTSPGGDHFYPDPRDPGRRCASGQTRVARPFAERRYFDAR